MGRRWEAEGDWAVVLSLASMKRRTTMTTAVVVVIVMIRVVMVEGVKVEKVGPALSAGSEVEHFLFGVEWV